MTWWELTSPPKVIKVLILPAVDFILFAEVVHIDGVALFVEEATKVPAAAAITSYNNERESKGG